MADSLHAPTGPEVAPALPENRLTRAIEELIAAEHEAVRLYERLADSTENALARKVLRELIDEGRGHIGEFRNLLSVIGRRGG